MKLSGAQKRNQMFVGTVVTSVNRVYQKRLRQRHDEESQRVTIRVRDDVKLRQGTKSQKKGLVLRQIISWIMKNKMYAQYV